MTLGQKKDDPDQRILPPMEPNGQPDSVKVPTFKVVILAGGKSSRMGQRKELLHFPGGLQAYAVILKKLKLAFPEVDEVYISLKQKSDVPNAFHCDTAATNGFVRMDDITLRFLYDDPGPRTEGHSDEVADIGPASGFLAAYHLDKEADWMVLACDYPFLSVEAMRRLVTEYVRPVTCFQNSEGFCEPLLAIWSPEALSKLEDNVKRGMTGPRFACRELGWKKVEAEDNRVLFNVNTMEDWKEAQRILKGRISTSC